jgi:hypothetical protein
VIGALNERKNAVYLKTLSTMLQTTVAPALLQKIIFVNVSVNEKLLLTASKSMLRKFWVKKVYQVTFKKSSLKQKLSEYCV